MVDRKDILIKAAKMYLDAGLQVIPNHPTKKHPVGIKGWQKKDFSFFEIAERIKAGWGIGIKNLEGLDFDNVGTPDAKVLFDEWVNIVLISNSKLLEKLVIEETPSGGFHVFWRCELIEGNQKLATRPPTDQELSKNPKMTFVTLIETRGYGGQFMVAPSNGYRIVQGHIYDIPVISIDDRDILINAAKALSMGRLELKTEINHEQKTVATGDRPGDIYNDKHGDDSLNLLITAGWQVARQRGDVYYLTRPGKDSRNGISATYGYIAKNVFYPFSSNASPFEAGKAYSPFAVFAILEHEGNYKEAASYLAREFGMNGNSNGNGKVVSDTSAWEELKREAVSQAVDVIEDKHNDTVFVPMSLKDLVNLPPKDWLLDNIFGTQDIGVIFGDGGSGKTFITIDMIFSMLTCTPFAGLFDVTRPLSVAYATDEGLGSLGERFGAMAKHYQIDVDQDINFYAFSQVPQLFDETSQFNAMQFARDMYSHGIPHIDVIIIDTFMNAMVGGDDNKNSDVNIAIGRVKQLRDALGATIILNHHTTKANGDYRGASALKGHSDFMIKVEVNGDRGSKVECYKSKHATPFKPMVATRIPVDWSFAPVLQWDEYGDGPTIKDIIHKCIIQNRGIKMTASSWYETIKTELPADRQTTEKYFIKKLKELEKSQLISVSAQDTDKPVSKSNPLVYWI